MATLRVMDTYDIEVAVLYRHLLTFIVCAESKLFDIHSIPDHYETPISL
jgi:hypothetical protein